MENIMITELIGLPGVGKTTYIKKFHQNPYDLTLKTKPPHKPESLNKIFLFIYILLRPKYIIMIFKIIYACKSGGVDTFRYTYRFISKIWFFEKVIKNEESWVFDELCLQALWSIYIKSTTLNTETIKYALKCIKPLYTNSSVIYLYDKNYNVMTYLENRINGTSRFDKFSDDEKIFYGLKGKQVMEWILYWMDKLDYPLEKIETNR